MYLIALLYAGFASVFTIGKAALSVSDPLCLVGIRMAIAGLLMLGYIWIKERKIPLQFNFAQSSCIFGLAFINIYLTNALEFWGLNYLSSTKTCFFYSLSPFIVAIGSFLFFGEYLSRKKWMGLIIGFVGFIPIIFGGEATEGPESFFLFSWPELAVFGAVISSALGWLLLKQVTQNYEISSILTNGLSMFIGGVITLFHSLLVEPWNPAPITDAYAFFIYTFALIIISNFFCYNLYAYLFKKFSATFISFSGFITPAFTAFYGYIFLQETIPLVFYPSFIVVSLGIFCFYQEELQLNKNEKQLKLSS